MASVSPFQGWAEPKKHLLQPPERTALVAPGVEVQGLRLTAGLFRQPEKGVPGAVRDIEELAAPALLLPQQGHGDAPPLPQQDGEHLLLLGGEVAEAVQEEVHALRISGTPPGGRRACSSGPGRPGPAAAAAPDRPRRGGSGPGAFPRWRRSVPLPGGSRSSGETA